jgi:hypothetical protein
MKNPSAGFQTPELSEDSFLSGSLLNLFSGGRFSRTFSEKMANRKPEQSSPKVHRTIKIFSGFKIGK